MVILICGASHTGKTILAQRLLERTHSPYLSLDHLKMGLIRSGHTTLTPADDEAMTPLLWPIVREMVKTAIENRQNLIVEGCYIPFDWQKDFDARYLADLRCICLVMTDAYLDAHFEDVKAHGSDLEKRLFDADASLSLDMLKRENRAFLKGFSETGEDLTLIEDDYEQTIKALLEQF